MLEHMKMPLTNMKSQKGSFEIQFSNHRYLVPYERATDLIMLFNSLKYVKKLRSDDEGMISLDEFLAEDIKKYTAPGLALKGARHKEGYTQIQLAKKMRIRQENLSKMERGKRPISLKMAKRFAKVLRVSYKVFL